MFRKLTIILTLVLLIGTAWARDTSDVYHEVQVVDERGESVTDITTVYIYAPDTTTDAVIYADRNRQNVITLPMTEASANTTLVDGFMSWWGPDGYDFSMTNDAGVGPLTNSNHRTRTASEGTLVFPSYMIAISSTSYGDSQNITMGDGSDWVINGGGVADTLRFTPASDNSAFTIGVSGTSFNSDFNVYVGTLLGFKVDAGVPSLVWDGGAATLNHNSNFNAGLCTGTSTGAITLGSATSGAWAIDGTTTGTINADDSIAITVSAGTIDIDSTGGDLGIDATDKSILIDAGEAAADDAIVIVTTGADSGMQITSLADIDITTTGAAGEDITITNTGGSVNITATEADAAAMVIQTTAAGGDLNLDSVLGRIEIEAEEDVADAVYIIADGGETTTLTIFNDTGTAADSIELLTDVGGITVTASAGPIVLNATGAAAGDYTATIGDEYILAVTGGIAVGSAEEAADAIGLTASGTAGGMTVNVGTAGVTFSGDIFKGYRMEVEDVVAAKSPSAAESGEVFNVIGTVASVADIVITLPTAVAGYVYHVVDSNETAGADVTITAAAGDKIDDGSAAASIVHDTDADNFASVTLVSIDATNWVIFTSTGTWTAE